VTGYAIFDDTKLIKYGTFATSSDDDIERFTMIRAWLLSMIVSWKPDYIGLEGIQFQEEGSGQKMGVTVFQTLARLQGILMITCHDNKVPFEICPTNTWRHSCGVKGKTRTDKKRSMQLLVQQWYGVKVSEDEADAIGIGHHLVGYIQKNTAVTNWEI
jgi:Holliday junction resolvasome RuvABC endonuclease subunit